MLSLFNKSVIFWYKLEKCENELWDWSGMRMLLSFATVSKCVIHPSNLVTNFCIHFLHPCNSFFLFIQTDDVCSFFERVLGKNCYTSIIKEHLIDGTALFLLEDEHLTSIFKMQLGPRLKLLNRIHKLKNGDLSGL